MGGKRLNLNDFIDKKYGCLTIIGVTRQNINARQSIVRVRCDCGRESDKALCAVIRPLNSCSRKCDFYQIERAIKTADKYIGKKIGYLTIISYVRRETETNSTNDAIQHRIIVKCKCDCGRMVNRYLYTVINSSISSCGQCNLKRCDHKETTIGDTIGNRLISMYHNIINQSKTINKDQLSKEWFNDDDPIPAIHNFVNYCRPLYEKCMNDGSQKNVFIHRIDINKLLGPDNVYFDHHIININYSGKVYY